jgi:hypothetical protein
MTETTIPKDQAAQELFNSYRADYESGHQKWLASAHKCNEYYCGNQWDEKDIAKLDKQGRPHLTINLIKPSVNAVCGEQRSTRAEFIYKPRGREADAMTADVLTRLGLHVQDQNDYDYRESQVFDDGLIQDRGFFDVRVDYDKNVNGEISIRADDPMTIILDADAKEYDPETWNRVYETYWLSMDEIEHRYGREKAEEVHSYASLSLSSGNSIHLDDIQYSLNRFGSSELTTIRPEAGSGAEKYIKSVRVVERQRRQVSMTKVFVDLRTGDIKDVPHGMPEERVQAILAQTPDLMVTKMKRKRIRWTVAVLEGKLLHDDWSPYPFFTKVPYFPYYRRGTPLGMVRDLLSPQEQLNKVESQELHVVNTTANSGWLVEDGSLVNMTDEELESRGAETGLVIRYRKNATAPDKIKPNQVPTGLDRKSQKTVEYMHRLSVNDSFLGQSGTEVSGVVIRQNKQSALVQLRPAFDNLNYTRKLVAQRVLWLIQNYYTDERVLRVTDYSRPERPEEMLAINQFDQFGDILNDVTLGEYDVIVASAPARDSLDDTEFAQLIEMSEIGIPIPPEEMVMRTNISNKFELAQRVAKLAGTGEPSEEELEAMAAAQELEFATMQANLEKIQGQTQELMTRARLNEAKASQAMREAEATGDPAAMAKVEVERERNQLQFEQGMAKIEQTMQQAILTAQTKQVIADKQVGVKQEQMRHNSALARIKATQERKPTPTPTRK